VGSGELIATTTLGAEAGFITFWVIIVSCIVKVAVQLEFGKHTILTGETAMQAFNKLPGPRFGKAKWSVWTVLLVMVIKLLQVGGIVGGVAIILNILAPGLGIPLYAFLIAIVVALMIFRGYYHFIEKISLGMIGLFTLFTFASLYFLTFNRSGGVTYHLIVHWIAHGGNIYQVLGAAPEKEWDAHREALAAVAQTFRPLTAKDRDRVVEKRLRIASAREGESFPAILERRNAAWDVANAAAANGLPEDASLTLKQPIKLALWEKYTPPPPSAQPETTNEE
jgi:hypothetical protein